MACRSVIIWNPSNEHIGSEGKFQSPWLNQSRLGEPTFFKAIFQECDMMPKKSK